MASNHRWSIILTVSIAQALLSGCATEAPFTPTSARRYNEILSSWERKDINDLIYAWGPPSSTFTMPNANRMFTWDHVKLGPTTTSASGTSAYLGYGVTVGGAQSVSFTETWDCHSTAIVSPSGTILSWFHKGNRCTTTYSETEYVEKLASNLKFLSTLKSGTPVTIHFYLEARDDVGNPIDTEISGYFQSHNNENITISKNKKGFFNASDFYPLKYIEAIVVDAETKN